MTRRRLTRRDAVASTTALGATALAGCLSGVPVVGSEPAVRVPAETRVGDPFRAGLSGIDPGRSVELSVAATDAAGREFRAGWTVRADEGGTAGLSGAVGPATDPATWTGSDDGRALADRPGVETILGHLDVVPSGTPSSTSSPPTFLVGDREAVDVTVRARPEGRDRVLASATATRVYVDPGVSRERVDAEGLVGWCYRPPGEGPHPGVVVLHGVLAAVPHRLSRLLATHGFATLAVRYVDGPGLPDALRGVPLEYFDRAVEWLVARDDVRGGRIGLLGVSRGVEAALLTAVRRDERTTVVGYAGGGLIERGVRGLPPEGWADRPAWTREGEPVAPVAASETVFGALREADRRRCDPGAAVDAVRSLPADVREAVASPVERIDGPVLLVGGGDDRQWVTVPDAGLTVDRLRRHDHPHPFGLLAYCRAGHVFGVPYADHTGVTGPDNGGTPVANARAATDSWPAVLAYLARGLGRA